MRHTGPLYAACLLFLYKAGRAFYRQNVTAQSTHLTIDMQSDISYDERHQSLTCREVNMPFTIEKLPDEPIVFVTMSNPFDVKQDVPQFAHQLQAIFDAEPGPLWDVTDVRGLSVDFSDMVRGMSMVTRGELAVLRHPKVRRFAIVASNNLILIAAKALGQQQYGAIPVTICESLDEAFAVVRAEIERVGARIA
jgi:hypothetical protein